MENISKNEIKFDGINTSFSINETNNIPLQNNTKFENNDLKYKYLDQYYTLSFLNKYFNIN